jgi:hypothetical protein
MHLCDAFYRFAAAHASGHICIYTRTDATTAASITDELKQTADDLKQYMIRDDIDSSANSSESTVAAVNEATATDTPELQFEVLNVSYAYALVSNALIMLCYLIKRVSVTDLI